MHETAPTPEDAVPESLRSVPLDALTRIDVALEGAWSETVVEVWSRRGGRSGFGDVVRFHPTRPPSVELYFPGYWIGIHCFRVAPDGLEFDEPRAHAIIAYVEARLAKLHADDRSHASRHGESRTEPER